jgi:DNA (cytosine-5)-methyltransferase 1
MRLSQQELAAELGVSRRTVRRWEHGQLPERKMLVPALERLLARFPDPGGTFSFIDLFAGIGGMRLGFEREGGRCLFTSEWNRFAQKTYAANFGDGGIAGDITRIAADGIPDHDVLLAGFPCQPFSIAGVSKKNALGRPHGFSCETQGTLFFDVARIIDAKRPAAFLLENVKNLAAHDRGNTFRVILRTLEGDLGYHVRWRIVDARHWVPQHRERILVAGFREETDFSWDALQFPARPPSLRTVLEPEEGPGAVDGRYILSDRLWQYLQEYARRHREQGNGFGFGLVGPDDTARTLSARYYKDGSEILVFRGPGHNPRRLTPRECARLMGFPDSFRIPVSDTQAYRQFGNSVVVPAIAEVARIMKPFVMAIKEGRNSTRQGRLFAS